MRTIIINEFGGIDKLTLVDTPIPQPDEGEVLIQIKAIGINPVDWKIREGKLKDRLPHQFPLILGWDFAGIVAETGHSARRFQVGDEVYSYCRRPTVQKGSYAAYIALPESYIAHRPKNISFEEAAAIPLTTLTAYQSIYSAAKLAAGESLVILGASGGVGSAAVQLGKIRGARVISIASKKNHAYLKSIGADEVIDYQTADFADAVKQYLPQGADVIFNCANDAALQKSLAFAKGRMVNIVGQPDVSAFTDKGVECHYVFVEPHVPQLEQIREWVENGQFKVHLQATYPFEEVDKAHQQIETLHTCGKIALTV